MTRQCDDDVRPATNKTGRVVLKLRPLGNATHHQLSEDACRLGKGREDARDAMDREEVDTDSRDRRGHHTYYARGNDPLERADMCPTGTDRARCSQFVFGFRRHGQNSSSSVATVTATRASTTATAFRCRARSGLPARCNVRGSTSQRLGTNGRPDNDARRTPPKRLCRGARETTQERERLPGRV